MTFTLLTAAVLVADSWVGGNAIASFTPVGEYPSEQACEVVASKVRTVQAGVEFVAVDGVTVGVLAACVPLAAEPAPPPRTIYAPRQ